MDELDFAMLDADLLANLEGGTVQPSIFDSIGSWIGDTSTKVVDTGIKLLEASTLSDLQQETIKSQALLLQAEAQKTIAEGSIEEMQAKNEIMKLTLMIAGGIGAVIGLGLLLRR